MASVLVNLSLSFFIRKFYVEENTSSQKVVETTKKDQVKLVTAKPVVKKLSAKTVTTVNKVSDDLVRLSS